MTTVNTTDDLLRAARENKEFREAFQREILTEELMAVPDDIKELKAIATNTAAGLKTYPVVAAVRLHRRIEDDDETRSRLYEDVGDFIETDNPDAAFWYKVDSDDMRPPSPR